MFEKGEEKGNWVVAILHVIQHRQLAKDHNVQAADQMVQKNSPLLLLRPSLALVGVIVADAFRRRCCWWWCIGSTMIRRARLWIGLRSLRGCIIHSLKPVIGH